MKQNFEFALSEVLRHEGGYVDHPRDPGGATNKGITIATFRRYVKHNGTKDDLRRLTTKQAGIVYRKQYWDKVRGDELPGGVDLAVFDFAVNSGPSRSVKFLQSAVGVAKDGKLGPVTLNAVKKANARFVIIQICDSRLAWLGGLKTFRTFGRGWTSRVNRVKEKSLGLVGVNTRPSSTSKPSPAPNTSKPTQPAPTGPKNGIAALFAALVGLISKLRSK